jgi:hypothetical protein
MKEAFTLFMDYHKINSQKIRSGPTACSWPNSGIMGSLSPRAKAKREETMEWIFGIFPCLREREKQLGGTLSGSEQ